MSTTRRKPKWWNIDWVELGCRGWDINVEGACYGEQKAMRARFDSCFVHLDRNTLGLHIHGHRCFVARVFCDLIAAGLYQVVEETNTVNWILDVGGTATGYPATTGNNTTAAAGYCLKLVA